ncbi:MAG: RpiB/LacA/LacB family sugar-phosphate isomerase [Candidatus Eremiobacteraeota bacterium]|nr:RpiB/LacA/LacB family sugar-phosphate isomerase [Candidatus Eremiobacteraeota bacterium]NNM92519.1 RpiB/LacA/LacB family sugar-phosphate isomerase [Candidatus Eremiobacteraeota bacterium]
MIVAVGSDERHGTALAACEEVRRRGHEVRLFGALEEGAATRWSAVGRAVGEAVASGACASGVLFCWTGTGVSIAANKVRGVRAALCWDAATAAGARRWNDANVLCASLRSTSVAVLVEMLEAWFATERSEEPEDRAAVAEVDAPPSKS